MMMSLPTSHSHFSHNSSSPTTTTTTTTMTPFFAPRTSLSLLNRTLPLFLTSIVTPPTTFQPPFAPTSRASSRVAHKTHLRPLESPTILTQQPSSSLRQSLASPSELDALEDAIADQGELHTLRDVVLPPGANLADLRNLRRLPGSNIYLGPDAKDARVKQAEFVKSSTRLADCPQDGLPEFALVGRSNVGKSSLVNTLVQRKELAQTSKKPGKTQVINHFLINKSWYLVDLPGYGYAKAPNEARSGWNAFTKDYFLRSKTLVCVLLLVDASIPPQTVDLECADWLGRNKIPMTIVFTKCDKKKKKKNGGRKAEENVKEFEYFLKKSYDEVPPWIMTSCVTNQGKDELLIHIAQLKNYWNR